MMIIPLNLPKGSQWLTILTEATYSLTLKAVPDLLFSHLSRSMSVFVALFLPYSFSRQGEPYIVLQTHQAVSHTLAFAEALFSASNTLLLYSLPCLSDKQTPTNLL